MAGLLLAMHEVSALCAGFITVNGHHTSPGMLAGPLAWGEQPRWTDPLVRDQLVDWTWMFVVFEVLDLVFILVYTFALLALVGRIRLPGKRGGASAHDSHTGTGRLVPLICTLALVDLIESVFHTVLAFWRYPDGAQPPGLATWLAVGVTYAKWIMFLVVIVAVMRTRQNKWKRTKQVAGATWIQRYSLLAFLPIAILAVLPLSTIVYDAFDQVPDVQRAWLDSGRLDDDFFWAAAVLAVFTLPSIFFMGRIRADFAARRELYPKWWPFFETDPETGGKARQQKLWLWLIGPFVLVAWALVAVLFDGNVSWWRLAGFCVIPLAVAAMSRALRKTSGVKPRELQKKDPPFAHDVMAVGDVLSVAALSLAGLALVRSFTGPVVLHAFGRLEVTGGVFAWQIGMTLAGVVTAVMCWHAVKAYLIRLEENREALDADKAEPAASGFVGRIKSTMVVVTNPLVVAESQPARTLDRQRNLLRALAPGADLPRGADGTDARDDLTVGLLAMSVIGFMTLCIWPQAIADLFGVIAAASVGMTLLTVMLGAMVTHGQLRQPPEIFQVVRWPSWIRPRATPIVSTFLIAVVVASWTGSETDVHPVAGGDPIPVRPTMADAFDDWLDADDPCTVSYGDEASGITVRPMLLLAAEGGGIRALYWTASALDRIRNAGSGCGRRAALFSAGASGGAVGLTLGRFDDHPQAAAEAMAGPDALSEAATSLLAGDLLAGATGIRFAATAETRTPDDRQLLDRAGLMETKFEEQAGTALQQPFLPAEAQDAAAGDGRVSGHLILTSTRVWDGCRALISQIELSGNAEYDGWPDCGDPDANAGVNSFDLFGAYGRDTGDGEQCLGNVRALTAALLASRFPYVTPSGVVGPCNGLEPAQLADGGYTDNTGLGTIVDIAPLWQPLVRAHNDKVLAEQSGELVIPMVVYLENGTGSDYTVVGEGGDQVTEGDVEAQVEQDEAEAEATAAGQGPNTRELFWPRSWGVLEGLIPPVGYFTRRNHKLETEAGLQEARQAVGDALCTSDGDATLASQCEQLKTSEPTSIGVFVVHQNPQPSMPAPVGWVLSEASQTEMNEDLDTQQANGRTKPSSGPGEYGTLYDLLLAMGLPTAR